MRVVPGTHIVRALRAVAALVLPLAAVTLIAAPASAAVRYMVTHTITVGAYPTGVAVDSPTHTLDIGTPVRGLALDPATGTAFLTSRGLLFVIDLATDTVITKFPVPGSRIVATDPARDTTYVTGTADVYVISRARNRPVLLRWPR